MSTQQKPTKQKAKPKSQSSPKTTQPTEHFYVQSYSYELSFDGNTKKERELTYQKNSSSNTPKVTYVERQNGKTVKKTDKLDAIKKLLMPNENNPKKSIKKAIKKKKTT